MRGASSRAAEATGEACCPQPLNASMKTQHKVQSMLPCHKQLYANFCICHVTQLSAQGQKAECNAAGHVDDAAIVLCLVASS